jgi:hypothetical protein
MPTQPGVSVTDDSFVQTHTDADRLMLRGGQCEVLHQGQRY